MTDQEMVAALDAVIARWQQAREILASIDEESPATAAAKPSQPVAEAKPASTPVSVQVTVLEPRKQRERRSRPSVSVETALSSAVPSGPVAVSAAEAARLRERTAGSKPAPIEHEAASPEPSYSLDDLVREIEGKLRQPIAS